jgi:hypothetical protein
MREERKGTEELDCRSSAIWSVLADKPQRISAIAMKLKSSKAFQINGRSPSLSSLRQAIRRELKKKPLNDRIGMTESTATNGRPSFLVCRKSEKQARKYPKNLIKRVSEKPRKSVASNRNGHGIL